MSRRRTATLVGLVVAAVGIAAYFLFFSGGNATGNGTPGSSASHKPVQAKVSKANIAFLERALNSATPEEQAKAVAPDLRKDFLATAPDTAPVKSSGTKIVIDAGSVKTDARTTHVTATFGQVTITYYLTRVPNGKSDPHPWYIADSKPEENR